MCVHCNLYGTRARGGTHVTHRKKRIVTRKINIDLWKPRSAIIPKTTDRGVICIILRRVNNVRFARCRGHVCTRARVCVRCKQCRIIPTCTAVVFEVKKQKIKKITIASSATFLAYLYIRYAI
jgi:hypothetical protein